MPLLAYPLALFGLLSIPLLTGIYLFRNRSRRTVVSSLILWQIQRRPKEGGVQMSRLQTPWLFLLELLALLLLTAAAAAPLMERQNALHKTIVILDNSYSMLARNSEGITARERAADTLESFVGDGNQAVQFVLAGVEPRLLGRETSRAATVRQLIESWDCRDPRTDLARALSRAKTLMAAGGRILVLTDQPAPEIGDNERIRWRAFGRALPNVGIVNASRTSYHGYDSFLIEIQNFSVQSIRCPLELAIGEDTRTITIGLKPRERRTLIRKTQRSTETITASLPDDPLGLDNSISLLPTATPRVRVRNLIGDRKLRENVDAAMAATGLMSTVDAAPELVVADAMARPEGEPRPWSFHVITSDEGNAYVGPFLMESDHPLTEGLSLPGEIWSADTSAELPGNPLISAGNHALLADDARLSGTHHVYLRINPATSTVPRSSAWPILFWNLLTWRAAQRPGFREPNIRLGQNAVFSAPELAGDVRMEIPDGKTQRLRLANGENTLVPDQPGMYRLSVGGTVYALSVNTMDAEESNLQGCVSGEAGSWISGEAKRTDYASLSWIFILIALAALGLHQYTLAKA